ncbi:MAG TPA: hypothetical protein VMV10_23375 [Pirellulales bacterium]|nr:hypothetical protein [Pirellulales bacterium]
MRCSRGVALGVVALALAGILAQQPLRGQDAAPKAEAKAAKPRAKPRGRLPAHYGAVVDNEQREKIYGIQQSYQPQIEALQAQLVALREKQAAEIDAVLTPEQKEKVKELAAAAKTKRAKAAESKKAGEDAKPSEAAVPATDAKPAAKAKKAS